MQDAIREASEALTAPQGRIVAICGTAGSSREEIGQQPDGVEIWGLNLAYRWMPRIDRWFEMHDPDIYTGVFAAEHRAWLAAATVPVYMQRRFDEFPASVAYPVDAVTEGGRLHAYFTSSIAYMIALAIHEGVAEIRLLGANMATGSEYAYQRAACEYWIGVAEARGITVYLPPSCPLMKGPRYGAVGASADLIRGIVDKREAAKLQMEQTLCEFVDYVRITVVDELGKPDIDVIATRDTLREAVRDVDIVAAACRGAVQVLDQLTDGQVALSPAQSGLVPVGG